MYEFYEELPLGVIILRGYSLSIEYMNSTFLNFFTLKNDIIGKSLHKIHMFNIINDVFKQCLECKINKKIKRINIFSDKYFDFNIVYKEDILKVYIYDVSEYIEREDKISREREKFLSIWSETRTKCDILEMLRNKEKEYLTHLKNVVNSMSEGLIVLDDEGKLDFYNKAVLKITAIPIEDLFDYKKILKFICDDNSMENIRKNLKYIYRKNHTDSIKLVTNFIIKLKNKYNEDYIYIQINYNPIINKENKLMNTIITLKDITEVKRKELMLEEQTRFVEDVVNTIDVPICVIEYPILKYKLINKKYKSIMKVNNPNKNEGLNTVPSNYVIDMIEKMNENINEIKQYSLGKYCAKDIEGKDKYYKVKFTSHLNKDKKLDKVFIHALDINDEIVHNKQLEDITKIKDEFFNMISHELRTPLTIIYSSLQLATDIYKDEITPNLEKIFFRINQNCRRLLKLINNILDISKAEAGFLNVNYSYFDIVLVTENIIGCVNLYAQSKGINLIFDTNREENIISLDKDKYEKIILNLLSNSIKFTPKGKNINVTVITEKDCVLIKIKDEGIGISKENLSKIFDRFVQVNNPVSNNSQGTGLGLSLVKNFVELMNGEIEVKSKLDEGTEFSLKFSNSSENSKKALKNPLLLDPIMNNEVEFEFPEFN